MSKLNLRYNFARQILKRWLKRYPHMVVPLLEDLMKFAELKFTVSEYEALEKSWHKTLEKMGKYPMEDFKEATKNNLNQ